MLLCFVFVSFCSFFCFCCLKCQNSFIFSSHNYPQGTLQLAIYLGAALSRVCNERSVFLGCFPSPRYPKEHAHAHNIRSGRICKPSHHIQIAIRTNTPHHAQH
uniref:Putative secreted protein n=1 Tax=Ixodes ricinus TaxID=34613 RepID=A0A6B0UFP6_IXORI